MGKCRQCEAEIGDLPFCASCGEPTDSSNSREDETPTTVLASDDLTDQSSANGESVDGQVANDQSGVSGENSGNAKSHRKLILSLTAVVVVFAIAAGAFLFIRSSQEAQKREAAALAAATVVSETMTELSGAQTTEAIRAVAVAAGQRGANLSAQGGDDPRVLSSAAALSAIAELEAITPDTLNQWPAQRTQVEQAVRGVDVAGTAMDPGPVLAAVDGTVAGAQKKLDEWQLRANVVREEQDKAAGELNTYESSARSSVEGYRNLRDDTADWLDRTQRASSISVSSTTNYLEDALSERKDIRDSLTSLTPPAALADQHNDVIAAVNLGIDGIDSLLDGMDSLRSCTGSSCTLERNSGYRSFLSASSTNTKKFDSAYEAWKDAVAEHRAAIQNMTVDARPVV